MNEEILQEEAWNGRFTNIIYSTNSKEDKPSVFFLDNPGMYHICKFNPHVLYN